MQTHTFVVVQSRPVGCNRVHALLVSQGGQGPNLDLEVGVDGRFASWSSPDMIRAKVTSVDIGADGRGTVTVEC